MTFKNLDEARGYLAAMIDGEGSVHLSRNMRSGGLSYQSIRDVRVTNTDRELIDATGEACALLGIKFNLYTRTKREGSLGNKPIHDLVISNRDGLEKIAAHVPLRCPRKRDKILAALETYTNYGRRPDKDEFELVYREKGQRGAAEHFGVSQGTIYNWVRGIGLTPNRAGRPAGSRWSEDERASRKAKAAKKAA